MKIPIVLLHDDGGIEKFFAEVTQENSAVIKLKLLNERAKIVSMFKVLQHHGKIKSIKRPKNKDIQPWINDMVNIKRVIKNSVLKIDTVFK